MSIKPNNLPNRPSQGAFTLVEVVLAMMILALLAGVLFSVVQTTLETAIQLNTRQLQSEEFNGLAEVCRSTFQTLDRQAQFTAEVKPAPGGGYVQQITIANAPLAFLWKGDAASRGSTIVAPRPQANGLLAFCLQHEIDPSVTGDTPNTAQTRSSEPAKWFVLVRDLKKMDWRFYDSRAQEWRKEWTDAAFRPTLVELTINSATSPDDTRLVFPLLPAAQG